MPVLTEYLLAEKFGLPKPLGEMSAKKIDTYIILSNAYAEIRQAEYEKAQGKEKTR